MGGRRANPEVADRFGENLRRHRRLADLSQEELGVRASLHRTEIGLLENGRRVARVDTLIQLCGALGIPAAHLLDGIDWVPAPVRIGDFVITARAAALAREAREELEERTDRLG